MKIFSSTVLLTYSLPRALRGLEDRFMDLNTTDARAWELAPQLRVSAEGSDVVSWINPATGTICRLERTGEYEIWHRVEMIVKPAVMSQVLTVEADLLLRNPYSEAARRAAAQAIVAVDAAAAVAAAD
jgi:hypothetical protein